MQRFLMICLFLVSGAALSCAPYRGSHEMLTLGEEWALGARLAGDVNATLQLLDDPAATAFLETSGRHILDEARGDFASAGREWMFHAVRDTTVRAYELLGGHIYVNSGLLAHTDDYAVFMAVLAHQVAHGLDRHSAERISNAFDEKDLERALRGKGEDVYQEILSDVIHHGALVDAGEDAVRDADRLAIAYLYKAGIDPLGVIDALRGLQELARSGREDLVRFAEEYPLTADRIEDARRQIRALPPKPLTREAPGFQAFREAMLRDGSPVGVAANEGLR